MPVSVRLLFPERMASFFTIITLLDPRWPITARLQEPSQARAINGVVNALKPEKQ